ncbi:tRNA 5-methoxyuridine(34)/uridine 5-oxyacetic acid(34) synthase CmoB [Marinospirillum perlucidum]|uniref:tRNA 5-methoxyuridine(34)/uridine 5-oxyacetic acid(34) synthase CmoB n=1 Tax=Marinospirillum perlucidum TaxID=1982602 RepID=UPI001FE75722|nr:tRNA 5-methoxyuridine(34)/uridine 5-oxyacetic acid(34) synthase CmoB [Marinospirillum perlucidum]
MKQPDFSDVYQLMAHYGREHPQLHTWLALLPGQLAEALDRQRHPEFHGWWQRIRQLPEIESADFNLQTAAITADQGIQPDGQPLSANQKKQVTGLLRNLMPWRKGPFDLQGTYIDTEWRSDYKWDRLLPHLGPLRGRRVLDVGGGSGYHAWRIAGEGAEWTLCIDPSPRFFAQFAAVKKLLGREGLPQVQHLPLGIEALPADLEAFDTLLSMGVLYHRRSPLDHLAELKSALRPGGELVLETLVVDGDEQTCLLPRGRYAAMGNVWFLPSVACLTLWLERLGFAEVRCVDINQTSTAEQRSTDWMTFQSLSDFLDPQDPNLTREGYPAPKRAILLARKPE